MKWVESLLITSRMPIAFWTCAHSLLHFLSYSVHESFVVGLVSRFGEEAGLELGEGSGEYVWVLDPIDGTKSFITGR